jgi:hypothetical protein
MTFFFVLEVDEFVFGSNALGQRFFGTYPDGQFRFADGAPGFYSSNRDHIRHDLKYTRPDGHILPNERRPISENEESAGDQGALRIFFFFFSLVEVLFMNVCGSTTPLLLY